MSEEVKKQPSLAKNGIFLLIYNIFNAIFPFLSLVYVTKIIALDPSSVSNVQYALNIVSYFALLAFAGIPTYGMREIAKYRDEKEILNKTYTELFIINAVTTTISLGAYIGLIFIVPSFHGVLLFLYLAVGLEIVLNYFNISWLYEGLEKFGINSIINIASKIVSFVFLVLLVKSDSLEEQILFGLISAIGISSNYLFTFLIFPRYARFTKKNLEFKKHIKPILFLVVVNLAIEIYSLVDVTMIGMICPGTETVDASGTIIENMSEQVTFYKNAHQIQRTLLLAVNTITLVMVPRLSKFYKDNKIDEYNELISKTFVICLLFAIPMTIGAFFISDYMINLLYGESYAPAVLILKILLPITIISPIGYLLGSRVCLVTGKEKYMPIAVGAGAVFNIGMNALLIWLFNKYFDMGGVGAAIASVSSEIIVLVVYLLLSHKLFKLKPNYKDLIKIGIATIVMSGFLVAMHFIIDDGLIRTIVQVAGAIVLYFGVLLASKASFMMNIVHKFIKKKEPEAE